MLGTYYHRREVELTQAAAGADQVAFFRAQGSYSSCILADVLQRARVLKDAYEATWHLAIQWESASREAITSPPSEEARSGLMMLESDLEERYQALARAVGVFLEDCEEARGRGLRARLFGAVELDQVDTECSNVDTEDALFTDEQHSAHWRAPRVEVVT